MSTSISSRISIQATVTPNSRTLRYYRINLELCFVQKRQDLSNKLKPSWISFISFQADGNNRWIQLEAILRVCKFTSLYYGFYLLTPIEMIPPNNQDPDISHHPSHSPSYRGILHSLCEAARFSHIWVTKMWTNRPDVLVSFYEYLPCLAQHGVPYPIISKVETRALVVADCCSIIFTFRRRSTETLVT